MCLSDNTSATTESEPLDIATAMFELKDAEGDILWWWHSHVNMATYFSSTDYDTIEQIGIEGACAATVFNKKGSMHSGLYVKTADIYPNVYTECETEVSRPFKDSFYKKAAKLYKSKYKEQPKAVHHWVGGHQGFAEGKIHQKQPSISNGISNLPDGFVSKPWVILDASLSDGWHIDVNMMDKETEGKWKNMFRDNFGYECNFDVDLQDFVEETLQLIAGDVHEVSY